MSWRRSVSAHMAHTPLSKLSLGRIRTDEGGFDLATSELAERPVAFAEALHAPADRNETGGLEIRPMHGVHSEPDTAIQKSRNV
jgi:hypothetical protein